MSWVDIKNKPKVGEKWTPEEKGDSAKGVAKAEKTKTKRRKKKKK